MSEINLKKIALPVLGIFGVIFGLLIWFSNSDFYIEKEYLEINKKEFNSTVQKKVDEHPVKNNKIYLKAGLELIIDREIFDQLKKGDSVIKKVNSDSIYFYTSNGIIINDYNKFKREKYLKSIK